MEGFNNKQILRKGTVTEDKSKESDYIEKIESVDDLIVERKSEDLSSAGKKKAHPAIKKASDETRILKDNAEQRIPEIRDVRRGAEGPRRLSAKQRAALEREILRRDTAEKISRLQTSFYEQMRAMFTGYRGRDEMPELTNYEDVRDSDREKRIKEAMKRENYAVQIAGIETELEQEADGPQAEVASKEEAILKINEFMKVSAKEKLMDSDEKFIENLSANYKLCRQAESVKKILGDAAEGGYLPEEIDLEAVNERIAGLEELKFYMDNRRALMKSPYYKYMTSKDISFTDDHIEFVLKKTNNAELSSYLKNLRNIRSQGFKRKKGIKSLSEKISKIGREQEEILRTRSEKRIAIEKLSDYAVSFKESPVFTQKNYDAGYSRELFVRKLGEFNALKADMLHMGSIKDMTANMAENQRMFEQAREFESLLVMAVRFDRLSVSDDDFMKLRAKIRVFFDAEKLANKIMEIMVSKPKEALDRLTYEDIENEADEKVFAGQFVIKDGVPVVRLGQNLQKHFEAVYRTFKEEHAERRENIKKMYGLMNPVKQGDDCLAGSISQEELEKRVKDYQKNALFSEHIIYGHQYLTTVWASMSDSLKHVYLRRTGIDGAKALVPKRSMFGATAGMSAADYIKMINLLDHGKEEEKLGFYRSMIREVESADPMIHELGRGESVLGNMGYKFRMSSILANFEDFAGFLKDPEEIAKAKAYHTIGCAHFTDPQNVAQKYIHNGKYARCLTLEDMFKYQPLTEQLKVKIEGAIADEDEYIQDGTTYAEEEEWESIKQILGGSYFAAQSRVPDKYINKEKAYEYAASQEVSKYLAFTKEGLWKETSKEELEKIKNYLSEHTGKKAAETDLIKAAGNLTKEVPGPDADDKAIVKYCQGAEDVFLKIMEMDPATISFKSYTDIVADEKKFQSISECIALTDSIPALLEHYSAFLNEKGDREYGKKLKLTREHIKEIEARSDLLKCVKPFFDGTFTSLCTSPLLKEFTSIDEMLHQARQIYEDRLKKAIAENKADDQQAVRSVMSFIDSLRGFDVNTPLNVLETRFRMMHGIHTDRFSTPLEVLNVLKAKESILKGNDPGSVKITVVGNEFFEKTLGEHFSENEMTVHEREKLLKKKNTAQFAKNGNMELLINGSMAVSNACFGVKRKMGLDLRMTAGEDLLDKLAPFMMAENTAYNESLVKRYLDEKTRDEMLDDLTRQVMALRVNENLVSDKDVSKNSPALEYITRLVHSYKTLLDENPGYMERLKNRRTGSLKNDERKLRDRLGSLFALSDYYRVRKLLICDPYYVLHESAELSTDEKSATNEDQVRIAKLFSLVNKCAERLKVQSFDDRMHDDMEPVLRDLEDKARRRAFMTGRVDFDAIDAERLKKTHKNIAKFLERTGINSESLDELAKKLSDPGAIQDVKKYMTEDVRGYLKAALLNYGMEGRVKGLSTQYHYTDGQRELINRLNEVVNYTVEEKNEETGEIEKIIKPKEEFRLQNPNNENEVYQFRTKPSRLVGDIVYLLGDEVSEDELIDVFEGLLIGYNKEIDLRDEKQWEYAKKRWISSAKRLYELETLATAKYEQTYGSLIGKIPTGFFMQSISPSISEFHLRTRLTGQNVLELTDEKNINTGDGKLISLGELLVKEGLLNKADNDRNISLSTRFQFMAGHAMHYYREIFENFNDEEDNIGLKNYTIMYSECFAWLHEDREVPMEGPGLSRAMRRKLWKIAEETGDLNILGGEHVLAANREDLGLYSPEEKKALKKQRADDRQIVVFAENYIDLRADDLYDETIKAINGENLPEETKELIRSTLINFHPGLYRSGEVVKEKVDGKEQRKETELATAKGFYRNLKKFLGIGVKPERLEEEKRQAFNQFATNLRLKISDDDTMYTPDDIMKLDNVRSDPKYVINGTNSLLKLLAKHRMYSALQDLTRLADAKSWMDKRTHDYYRGSLRKGLSSEIIYAMMNSEVYLNLGDIENQGNTLKERRYEMLKMMGLVTSRVESKDLDKDLLADGGRELLEEFGIRIDEPLEIKK